MNNLQKLGFDNWFWESSARSPLDIPSGKNKVGLTAIGLGGLPGKDVRHYKKRYTNVDKI